MKSIFLHQFFLHISEWCITTKFQSGPELSQGSTKVQNKISAPSVGTIRNSREMYSWTTFILFVFCNLPNREYAVKVPDSIMKGSVYKLAALPSTVQDWPRYWNRTVESYRFAVAAFLLENREISLGMNAFNGSRSRKRNANLGFLFRILRTCSKMTNFASEAPTCRL